MKLTELAFGLFFPSAPRRAIVLRPVGSIPLAASLLSLLKPDGRDKKTHTKVDNVNIALGDSTMRLLRPLTMLGLFALFTFFGVLFLGQHET